MAKHPPSVASTPADVPGCAEDESLLSALVSSARDAILSTGRDGTITSWNPGAERLFGFSREEAMGTPVSFLIPRDRVEEEKEVLRKTLKGTTVEHYESQRVRKGGGLVEVSLTMSPIRDSRGRVVGTSTVAVDNTERQAAEAELRKSVRGLRKGFDNAPIGMALITRDGRFVDCNPALLALLQASRNELLATTFQAVTNPADLEEELVYVRQMLEGTIHSYRLEKRLVRADGQLVSVVLSCSSINAIQPKPDLLLFQVEDLTSRKLAESRLIHQALHDSLTDLPNRTLLLDHVAQALARSGRTRRQLALLFLDLDRFKLINDGLGHEAGDELLVVIAGRLRAVMRPHDTVARFGGDEFVVLCEDVGDMRGAMGVADSILATIAEPVSLGPNEVVTTASIGVVFAVGPETPPDTLLGNADAAMYESKAQGGGRCNIFDEGMRTRVTQQIQTENALRRALQGHELGLVYQPQVELATGRITGMEALVRWHDPESGIVSPSEFIPVAEASGLILPLGDWVLEEACRQAAAWQEPGAGEPLTMSVNVSAHQLARSDFGSRVATILSDSLLAPDALCLEITESAVMDAANLSLPTWAALQSLGVRIDVDDFGTGYSSLSRLKRLRVDMLKIDQSFVEGVTSSSEDSAIVEAVVRLADALHLGTVAEGVEAAEQADMLSALGCDFAQGYYFARPEPAEAVGELIGRSLPSGRHH